MQHVIDGMNAGLFAIGFLLVIALADFILAPIGALVGWLLSEPEEEATPEDAEAEDAGGTPL